MPHLIYPFICWWILRFLPYLGNNSAMNTEIQISFQINVLILGGYIDPEVELLSHMVVLALA